jgi:hypothetical protein
MGTGRSIFWILCVALSSATLARPAGAHPLAPALLEIVETAPGQLDIEWRTSRFKVPGTNVRPVLPVHCKMLGEPEFTEAVTSLSERWSVQCDARSLVGERIAVTELERAKTDALLRITLADGRQVQRVVRAREPFLIVPEGESSFAVFLTYLGLGFEHIMLGPDHLLFVFGLLLLVPTTRILIGTITAFTLGHSITLSLAVLGFVGFPSRPIEFLIALTVFVLAVELARAPDMPPTLMRRLPWLMAVLFGLLHGLGFAGALSEVGLPGDEIPVALFSFNVGIELGQILFVVVILALMRLLRGVLGALPQWTHAIPVYAMGTMAAFWCFERAAGLYLR